MVIEPKMRGSNILKKITDASGEMGISPMEHGGVELKKKCRDTGLLSS